MTQFMIKPVTQSKHLAMKIYAKRVAEENIMLVWDRT